MGVLTREERQAYRKGIDAAQSQNDDARIEELREERRALRKARREERRAEGKAPDQVIGRTLASVWDEKKAREFVDEDLTDIAHQVLDGELTFEEAVDEALVELAEDADDLLDFSGIPVVGDIIEAFDGVVFRMFLKETLRPWVAEQLRKILPGD